MRSPLIGGLNGSLGSRCNSGTFALGNGEAAGTPRRGPPVQLPHPHSPGGSAGQQRSGGSLHDGPKEHQQQQQQESQSDMQVCCPVQRLHNIL